VHPAGQQPSPETQALMQSQVAAQSLSSTQVHPAGQQPSLLAQSVMHMQL
jgi:hypothetical protein